MGITGLIPFLEKASSAVNMKQLEGSSVAVDSYCWLHKGVFACAEKLIRGDTTDVHIRYCLKYVDMLLSYKMKVIMVFDGRHLPAKAETERRRRNARNESKQLAKEYLRKNELEKARSHMRRAIDVTHEMALELIKACRSRSIDCIVAPYEADAQMAWLNKQGLAEYVITEDSDLTLFGARKILFKLDLTGKALLVENTKLYLAMGCTREKYTFDKFRRMCILSGCDYLDSLYGIGLKKACRFILTTEENDMKKALKKIPGYLKMKQLDVTDEYIESFLKAEATFKHMFIYNPLKRRMERLHDLNEYETDESYCTNAGSLLNDAEQAFQLALGNLNPFSLRQVDDWNPNQNWSQVKSKHKSIWQNLNDSETFKEPSESMNCTKETEPVLNFKKIEFKNMAEQEIEDKLFEEKNKLEEAEIFSMYKNASPKIERKRKRRQSSVSSCDEDREKILEVGGTPKKCPHNPFAKPITSLEDIKKSPVCANNSLLKVLSPKKINEQICKNTSVKSRFFAENIRQHGTKPFAARDLTCEMLKIENKSNIYMEQQQNLYVCSLKSPNKIIEEEKQNTNDDNLLLKSNESNWEKCDFSTTDKERLNICKEAPNLEEEIVLVSDCEEDYYQKSSLGALTQKSKAVVRKTKSKSQITSQKSATVFKTVDAKQSKLSMFGFQRRPLLKKL